MKIKNLEEKSSVEIITEEGKFKGFVQMIYGTKLMIISLFNEFQSPKAHGHKWDTGELKSVLFKRVISITKLS